VRALRWSAPLEVWSDRASSAALNFFFSLDNYTAHTDRGGGINTWCGV
jgi:hypothetical protein